MIRIETIGVDVSLIIVGVVDVVLLSVNHIIIFVAVVVIDVIAETVGVAVSGISKEAVVVVLSSYVISSINDVIIVVVVVDLISIANTYPSAIVR